MSEIVDYGRFAERLARVMPRWDARDRMTEAEFAAHLADTGPRWELLDRFQREWGYEPSGRPVVWPKGANAGHGEHMRKLGAEPTGAEQDEPAGADLSLPIPRALDEWWELPFNSFSRSPWLYWTNPEYPPRVRPDPSGYGAGPALPEDNPFVGPDEDRRVCVFMAEYEYCNEWGYLAAEAHLADPRVLVGLGEEWTLQDRSISEFFLHLAIERLPASLGWRLETDDDPELVERMRAAFPDMGLQPWRELEQEARCYGGPDVIVRHDTGSGDFPVLLYGRTREAVERAAQTLGIDLSGHVVTGPERRP
ncbi:hypothetical protein [Thermomonospora catenispora]|uniref:hypothetical protein n=1 Tax=Thermomonospora catenispora TaxID=2493090 RepID=UPI001123AEEE|nr:hypothetical protein [Thermomonospora catenispora]TNY37116.1 hypothetical protein EIO00_09735 [Thermomonospora catenispora]